MLARCNRQSATGAPYRGGCSYELDLPDLPNTPRRRSQTASLYARAEVRLREDGTPGWPPGGRVSLAACTTAHASASALTGARWPTLSQPEAAWEGYSPHLRPHMPPCSRNDSGACAPRLAPRSPPVEPLTMAQRVSFHRPEFTTPSAPPRQWTRLPPRVYRRERAQWCRAPAPLDLPSSPCSMGE